MHIEISGTAQVRHSRSGLVYEIESDELEWDVEGGDEGQMGGRNRWYAEVQHNELGTLVWSLWEYPVGAEEYQDQDLNGHVLVKDFDIYLAHDPDGPDEADRPRYRTALDDVAISENELSMLDTEQQVPYLAHWFLSQYWDPANDVSYNSREGGYLWNHGGPYSANEELRGEFESVVGDDAIEEAASEIEIDGITDWSPRPEHPDRQGEGWDDLDPPESDLEEQLDTAIYQLSMVRQPQFGSPEEVEARVQLKEAFEKLDAELGPEDPKHGGIGHNGPPIDERFTDEEIAEMRQATDTALVALDSEKPDAMIVAQQSNKIVRILKGVAKRSGELFNIFANKAAENAGARFGDAIGAGLAGGGLYVIVKVLSWLALII